MLRRVCGTEVELAFAATAVQGIVEVFNQVRNLWSSLALEKIRRGVCLQIVSI